MTLTELRYLVALARERHFGHAAQVCNVSQPTLSAAIKKLEEQLGMPLFERRPREVVVTPQAEPIVAQAQRVLEQADLLEQMAMSQRDQLGSPLRVGAIFTVAPYLFPTLVPRVHAEAPEMPLFIEENYTHVLRGKLERAVSRGHHPLSSPARSRATNQRPKEVPAINGRVSDARVTAPCGTPMSPPMSATAATASTAPRTAGAPGRSPRARPTATGMTAETTPVTGAATVIDPRESAA